MKKTIILLALTISLAMLSGCGSKEEAAKSENKLPSPVEDPAGYVPGMIGIKEKAQQDINNAANKENERLNNTLNENDMNSNLGQNASGSDLVKKYTAALIKTSLGNIEVKFFSVDAPATVNNFLKLSQNKFYEGTKFHRVIKGFMIQGGDPNSKNADTSTWGTGGPGYKFNDELKGTEKYPTGTLAMANSGPNTNGSQFFIVTASPEAPLPASYTVFGIVTRGLDVAIKIENVKTTGPPADRPLEDISIKSIELLEEK